MPCHYEIFSDLNLAVFTYFGVLRVDEIVQNAEMVDSDPLYTSDINELADFREMRAADFDDKTLENLSGLLMGLYLRSGRRKRIAMLVPNTEVQELAQTFADIISEHTPISVAIFKTTESALGFLGLTPRDLPEQRLRLLKG